MLVTQTMFEHVRLYLYTTDETRQFAAFGYRIWRDMNLFVTRVTRKCLAMFLWIISFLSLLSYRQCS